jgi:hypothetical protein
MLVFGAFGAVCGMGLVNVMALVARGMKRPCDTIAFTREGDVRGLVANWAKAHGFRHVRTEGTKQTYKRGRNLLTAPAFVEYDAVGDHHTLRAYVQIDGLLAKGDIALSGGGFLVRLPRSMARADVNRLMASLQQPPLPK